MPCNESLSALADSHNHQRLVSRLVFPRQKSVFNLSFQHSLNLFREQIYTFSSDFSNIRRNFSNDFPIVCRNFSNEFCPD